MNENVPNYYCLLDDEMKVFDEGTQFEICFLSFYNNDNNNNNNIQHEL